MFQTLDDKGSCVGVYKDGELYFDNIPEVLDKTWNYVGFLKDLEVEYASIYAAGSKLEDCCPQHLKGDWDNINRRLRAFVNSLIVSKVSLTDNCFFDVVPERFLKEYCELKNRICQHVFDTKEKPQEYSFFRKFNQLIYDVSSRELQIDRDRLATLIYTPQGKRLWEKVNSGRTNIKYNMFSSVTGRLTVEENSFPILNLASKLRDVIKPTNDWFVSFDLNAAEKRIALALAGQNQPTGDLHDEAVKLVFNNEVTRAQSKSITTQWLYDSQSEDARKWDANLSKYYNKPKLLSDHWINGYIHTPYGRKIEADRHHAISYLNQSTLIDMFHRQILKVAKYLENKRSFVAFMVHDQLVIDLKDEEKNSLKDIINVLSNTPYGTFPVKVEIGADFGNMKKVNIKV